MSEVLDATGLESRTLDEIAEIANREHAAVGESLGSALRHAMACGEAIYEAHKRVASDWKAWVREHLHMTDVSSSRYERLFVYRDHLPPEVFVPRVDRTGRTIQPTMTHAYKYLRGLPQLGDGCVFRTSDSARGEVRRLLASGLTHKEVAELTGVSRATVTAIADPDAERQRTLRKVAARKKRAAAKRALREKEIRDARTAAAKRAGGALEKSLSLVRELAQTADRAWRQADDPERQQALNSALAEIHRAEDHIGAALRVPSSWRAARLKKAA